MKLSNKLVLITGAGSGIGREMALQLVRSGSRVIGVDIRGEALEETRALLDSGVAENFIPHALDVTDRDAVKALPELLIAKYGELDCLINCAGMIQPFVRFAELDEAAMERVFNVNWFGTLYMTRAFLPHLLARPEAQLVNFGSMSSIAPLPGQAIYGASKAAVKLLTESLYAENMGSHLHVTLILPGAVSTDISKNSGLKLAGGSSGNKRPTDVATAEDAARTIIEGIESNAYRVLVDKMVIDVDALYRQDPRQATETIASRFSGLLDG
ncbi:SDR family NAD(P)-dependent oxidoreductase [Parasphingorhabdus sp.]|uniref:SDR family NAD(P)-dependent oxidoreductase n=1 Tax=Parasphingorhabdus sp. TaxID=2709688 RepID=UPI003A8EA7CF